MASKRYWFSAKQKRMRDALGGNITTVRVADEWREYTTTTDGNETPTVWNDFELVAEGSNLEVSSMDATSVGLLV